MSISFPLIIGLCGHKQSHKRTFTFGRTNSVLLPSPKSQKDVQELSDRLEVENMTVALA